MNSAPYPIEILPRARREINRIKRKNRRTAEYISDTIYIDIAEDPHSPFFKDLEEELAGHRAARTGPDDDYRIIFRIHTDYVRIVRVGHRSEIYLR